MLSQREAVAHIVHQWISHYPDDILSDSAVESTIRVIEDELQLRSTTWLGLRVYVLPVCAFVCSFQLEMMFVPQKAMPDETSPVCAPIAAAIREALDMHTKMRTVHVRHRTRLSIRLPAVGAVLPYLRTDHRFLPFNTETCKSTTNSRMAGAVRVVERARLCAARRQGVRSWHLRVCGALPAWALDLSASTCPQAQRLIEQRH